MKKTLLIILGFFLTGGSIASSDLLGLKKKPQKTAEKQCSSSETCHDLPVYPVRCERRW